MMQALRRLFSPEPAKEQAHAAYVAIVAQARQPFFYAAWQVEDTIDGRFDVILLHLHMVMTRLEAEGEKAHDFIRALSEVFFSDMDRSLREMGASDTGVGKRIKKMAQAYYGRMKTYRDAATPEELRSALHRNLYREKPVDEQSLAHCCAYTLRNRAHLATQSADVLLQGDISFTG